MKKLKYDKPIFTKTSFIVNENIADGDKGNPDYDYPWNTSHEDLTTDGCMAAILATWCDCDKECCDCNCS